MAEHKNSVYGKISEDIEKKIADGEYALGLPIPPERELCRIYGVERMTVRRALDVLTAKGMIAKKPGLGNFVSDGKSIPVYKNEKKSAPDEKLFIRKKLPEKISVHMDFSAAAELVFNRLENLGHRRIMFAGASEKAYSAVCAEAIKRKMFDADIFVPADERNTAENVFEKIWRGTLYSKPSAVIASDCGEAEKIIYMAERMGISVPDELAVIALCTNKASGISGVIFDEKSISAKLCAMLETVPDAKIPHFSVYADMKFSDGETLAEAKNQGRGSGSMSAYLL